MIGVVSGEARTPYHYIACVPHLQEWPGSLLETTEALCCDTLPGSCRGRRVSQPRLGSGRGGLSQPHVRDYEAALIGGKEAQPFIWAPSCNLHDSKLLALFSLLK